MVSKDIVEQANEFIMEDEHQGEEFPDFVDPSEFEYEDWQAYHSEDLMAKWESYKEECYDKMEPEGMTFSDMCYKEYENSLSG